MEKDVIIACDFASAAELSAFLQSLKQPSAYLKIGMELFYAEGMKLVDELKRAGHRIFLDLKLHDIPNTVARSMRVLAQHEVDMINVHAAGTIDMMSAAAEALDAAGSNAKLIAVTQLTSTSEVRMNDELGIAGSILDCIVRYAQNAKAAGLCGVVCSPLEVEAVKAACGMDFLAVTPGIRFADSSADDQIRIADPARAALLGSDYIVVGRPITKADDPTAAYMRCLREFGVKNE